MSVREAHSERGGWVRVVVSVVVCAALLAVAGGMVAKIYGTEPVAEREAQTRRTAALVEVVRVESGTYRPTLPVLGVVRPARDVVLTPRVSGQVEIMERAFVPGGLVSSGEVLLRLDATDYERVVRTRRSEVLQVEAELEIERGLGRVAEREYELLKDDVDEGNRSLVLREPQIAIIEARLDAALSAYEQARLNLERTAIRAPFDALVLEREVNIGSQVGAGDALGRLVGVDEYWVIASVPLRDLRWITFDDGSGRGARVRFRNARAWGESEYRDGWVTRLIGEVDGSARLARVLVTLPDPLARETNGPAVVLGTLLQLDIEVRELSDVVRLDRRVLRQNDTVWMMTDGALEIRAVTVVFGDEEFVYVSEGLEPGEMVVTTSLATVSEGLSLRVEDDPSDELGGDPETLP